MADINKIKESVRRALNILESDALINSQAKLYTRLRTEKVTLKRYFVEQKKLDDKLIKESELVCWGLFKKYNPNRYEHERSHYDVWKKYGVKTRLYCWRKHLGSYYVLDKNFPEVADNLCLGTSEVVAIYKEMLKASFCNRPCVEGEHLMDIFYFEVLNGLDKYKEKDIYLAFKKYNWQF